MCVGEADGANGDFVLVWTIGRATKVDEDLVEEGEAGGERVVD